MYPITVTCHTPAQFAAVVAALALETTETTTNRAEYHVDIPAKVAAPVAPEVKPAKAEKPTKAAPVKLESKPTPIPYETVRQATVDLLRAKDRGTVLALLERFSVAKTSDLQPEQYADYLAGAHALLTIEVEA